MADIMPTHSFRNPLTVMCPITEDANMLNTAKSERLYKSEKLWRSCINDFTETVL
jgi:hypothetical protein